MNAKLQKGSQPARQHSKGKVLWANLCPRGLAVPTLLRTSHELCSKFLLFAVLVQMDLSLCSPDSDAINSVDILESKHSVSPSEIKTEG